MENDEKKRREEEEKINSVGILCESARLSSIFMVLSFLLSLELTSFSSLNALCLHCISKNLTAGCRNELRISSSNYVHARIPLASILSPST